jgi:nitroreductase
MNSEHHDNFEYLFSLIKSRRAVREFTDKPISNSDIRDIVESAIWAPTASNMNARLFIVVRDPQNILKIKAFSPGMFSNPNVILVLCTDKKKAFEVGGELGASRASIMDIAVSAQNILLASWAKGIGTSPLASFNPSAISKILNLPEHIYPDLIITMGYPRGIPEPPSRPKFEEVTFYERFGRKEA